MAPGVYTIRLTADGVLSEQPITIKLDPRVTISESDLKLQTELSLACYASYHELQTVRELIDKNLSDTKYKWAKGKKEQAVALRGSGPPDNPDIMYGGIAESSFEK
ncbi:MAG: hypothetical protein U5K54_07780 [Cytophagales bacterium]|nr:hypothetical protein [Cytophagales bacterium]